VSRRGDPKDVAHALMLGVLQSKRGTLIDLTQRDGAKFWAEIVRPLGNCGGTFEVLRAGAKQSETIDLADVADARVVPVN
jgi:hypothetical protein